MWTPSRCRRAFIVIKVNGTANPHLTDKQIYEMARRSRHPVIAVAETLVRAAFYRVSDWTAVEERETT